MWDEEYQAALADSGGDLSYAAVRREPPLPDPRRRALDRRAPAARRTSARRIQTAMRAIEAANPERLAGIFGDAPWTNKERLPDDTLKNLIEHFSTQTLSVANVPEDELGNGYEYLIKKFADDTGHTAAEFYTNRTLVHLMTQMLEPQAGRVDLRPHLRHRRHADLGAGRGEAQRRRIPHAQALRPGAQPHHLRHRPHESVPARRRGLPDRPRATPWPTPSIHRGRPPAHSSTWSWPIRRTRSSSGTARRGSSDPWGRNFLGTPPQGRADYAFFQHILTSLDPTTGRCAILFPHGVLFRNEEQTMRAKLVEPDLVEGVLGLGPNLFYNSPMEACIVVCNRSKPAARKGKVLFIDAVNEVTRERAQSFLKPEHQQRILAAYKAFADEPGFAKVATLAEIAAKEGNLSIPLYVKRVAAASATDSNGEAGIAALGLGRSGKPMAERSGSRWMRWWKRWMVWSLRRPSDV